MRINKNKLIKAFLLSLLMVGSGLVCAVDTDQDGLPDDWELANGRDPLRADYFVAQGSYSSNGNSYINTCIVIEGAISCYWGEGGYGSYLPSNVSGATDVYGATVNSQNICIYRGDINYAYKNCWNLYVYPPTASETPISFSTPKLQTSFSVSEKVDIYWCAPPYSIQVTKTKSCSVASESEMKCTVSQPRYWKPYPGGSCNYSVDQTITLHSTKGLIGHIYGNMNTSCAVTEFGSECFNGSIYSINHDVDSDGVNSISDNCPLSVNADQLDHDGDFIGNVCDLDDDNDGVPDVVDAEPLNAANKNEISLPLNGSYKGLQYQRGN